MFTGKVTEIDRALQLPHVKTNPVRGFLDELKSGSVVVSRVAKKKKRHLNQPLHPSDTPALLPT